MSFPKLGSQCRQTLKHIVHKHQQNRINYGKIVPSSGVIRNLATDGSNDPKSDERVPGAGKYRSPWKILREEFEGIQTMKPAETEVPRETDVLIIGGGIVGSSVAYWIKQLNPAASAVTVIERDPVYTRTASMLSWEGVRHQFSLPENVQLSMCASEFFCNIKQHLSVIHESPPDIQFNHQGYLILAQEKDADQLAENVTMQKELGARIVLLSKTQLSEKYPWMNFDGIECGSLGLEGEGWLDPWSLLRALKQKNISMGTKYIHGELIGFEVHNLDCPGEIKFKLDSGVTRTKDGREYETKFGIVINCAGPWAADVAELAGIGTGEGDLSVPLPVLPRKRNVYVTHCPAGPTLDCPFVIDPSGLFFRREGFGGNYICGRTPASKADEPSIGNFDVDLNLYDESVLPVLTRRAPCFHKSNLKTSWAGYSDENIFDQNLVIGPHPYLRNFIFANGFSGHGMQHALGVGRAIMELIFDKDYKTINMEKFHFRRFLDNAPIKEQMIL